MYMERKRFVASTLLFKGGVEILCTEMCKSGLRQAPKCKPWGVWPYLIVTSVNRSKEVFQPLLHPYRGPGFLRYMYTGVTGIVAFCTRVPCRLVYILSFAL